MDFNARRNEPRPAQGPSRVHNMEPLRVVHVFRNPDSGYVNVRDLERGSWLFSSK